MSSHAPPLHVSSLSKRFRSVQALRDVGFDVRPGEVFGYLGPNGAGKTTTLRAVLGLVRPDSGTVRLFGRPPRDPRSRDRIGFLPGELSLYREMSGHALLDHFARFRPHRPPVLRERLLAKLAFPDEALHRRIKVLSHGTRQKLGLVVAMQHAPDLVLLDEPSTALDPLVQQGLRAAVLEIAGRGGSVLLSSHVLSEVEAVCQRVAILREGELVALAPIEELRARVVRHLTVRFRREPPPGLRHVEGVTAFRLDGNEAVLWVRGDVNPLLRVLAAAEVEHLVFPEPLLEDIFLGYYRAEGAGR